MSIALVNFSSGGAAGGPQASVSSAAQNITQGNSMIVAVRWGGSAVQLSDTAGNKFLAGPSLFGQSTADETWRFWYLNSCIGNASNVVTATLQSGITNTFTTIFVWQISGGPLTPDFQFGNFSGAGSNSAYSSSPFNTRFINEIVLTVGVSTTTANTQTASGGYTMDGNTANNGIGGAHKIFTTPQNGLTASFTQGGSTPWEIYTAGFGVGLPIPKRNKLAAEAATTPMFTGRLYDYVITLEKLWSLP